MNGFAQRLSLAAGLLAVFVCSTPAEAQRMGRGSAGPTAGEPGFAVYGGMALPTGDGASYLNLGFTVGAQYDIPLRGALGLRANADFTRFAHEFDDASTSYSSLMANLVYRIETGTAHKPYLLGGLGVAYGSERFLGTITIPGLALNFGAGYNFTIGDTKLFTELRYVIPEMDNTSGGYLPIVVGLRF